MKRRRFIQSASAAMLAGAALSPSSQPVTASAAYLPRWRGFNLLEKFTLNRNQPYVERDFEWMAAWGFDFVRLPMDYRCWTDLESPYSYDESALAHIDQVIDWGRQYGIHINLNLHRAPGYCVNPPEEPLDLWTSPDALKQFQAQWKNFAERYKGIPNEKVSFDLLNEPKGDLDEAIYSRVMTAAIDAIREADPERLIVVDGLRWGQKPIHSLADLNVAQSTRGYNPFQLSHYKASWVGGSDTWPVPEWPMKRGDEVQDKQWIYDNYIVPWKEIEPKGVGVHVGEWGCYNKTPHNVALHWMKDCLSLWKEAGWGWSLWNLRGSFGVVDSGRDDVQYENLDGHNLDRRMLELIRAL